jgi:hypothetical protein
MCPAPSLSYRVSACNISHASENKIHDDGIARTLGFAGGLVPGAEVFAYACHPVVRHWRHAWLERGEMHCRFLKPVYDGRIAEITADAVDGGLNLQVTSQGIVCATGAASLSASAGNPPAPHEFRRCRPPTRADRPPADEASLARSNWLGMAPLALTGDRHAEYLEGVRERDPLYAREGIVHPGFLVRLCNYALRDNVVLPPWIHTGSRLVNFSVARVGDELEARARVADNYERKGHRLVDLDVLIIAQGTRPIARIMHTAVYRLRQLSVEGQRRASPTAAA